MSATGGVLPVRLRPGFAVTGHSAQHSDWLGCTDAKTSPTAVCCRHCQLRTRYQMAIDAIGKTTIMTLKGRLSATAGEEDLQAGRRRGTTKTNAHGEASRTGPRPQEVSCYGESKSEDVLPTTSSTLSASEPLAVKAGSKLTLIPSRIIRRPNFEPGQKNEG